MENLEKLAKKALKKINKQEERTMYGTILQSFKYQGEKYIAILENNTELTIWHKGKIISATLINN